MHVMSVVAVRQDRGHLLLYQASLTGPDGLAPGSRFSAS